MRTQQAIAKAWRKAFWKEVWPALLVLMPLWALVGAMGLGLVHYVAYLVEVRPQ